MNKHSSPFDGPDYFTDFQNHIDDQDEFDVEGELDAQDQPLLGHHAGRKGSGKHGHFKDLVRSGSKKLSQVSKRLSVRSQRLRDSKRGVKIPLPPSTSTVTHWEYDRFDPSVPESVPELLFHIDSGRHPQILELAIESRKRQTPQSQYNTLEYKILDVMLTMLQRMRQRKELDDIQNQTLEQLGRWHDRDRFS